MTELESAQQFRTATNICSQSLRSENSGKRFQTGCIQLITSNTNLWLKTYNVVDGIFSNSKK